VTTKAAPTEAELEAMGFFDEPVLDEVQPGDTVDWSHRKEVYRLDNGAVLIAKSEIEAAAYANKGAVLSDVIND
jgi:plastocyanin